MIVKFRFRYGVLATDKVSPEVYAELLTEWPELPSPQPPDGYTYKSFVATWSGVQLLARHRIDIEFDELESTMIVKLADRMEKIDQLLVERAASGTAVQIHVPNLGLMLIDDVQVLTDACTDALRDELDAGWRILAVCPPNAQRRPDYVLGRTKPR